MPQRLVPVQDRTLAAFVEGSGDIAVVLETGLGAPSESWQAVQSALAPHTSVWRYDRAGRGRSSRAETPRTADRLVSDLHAVVTASSATRVVLVGNSLGGMIVRLYAHAHRDRVAGLVLVDGSHQDQFDRIGPLLPPASSLPVDAQGFHRFWAGGGWRDPAQNDEAVDFLDMKRALDEMRSLGDLPLVVLVAGGFLQMAPPPLNRALQDEWVAMQSELAGLSAVGRLTVVEGSGHFMQQDRPDVVVAAVESLLGPAAHAPTAIGSPP